MNTKQNLKVLTHILYLWLDLMGELDGKLSYNIKEKKKSSIYYGAVQIATVLGLISYCWEVNKVFEKIIQNYDSSNLEEYYKFMFDHNPYHGFKAMIDGGVFDPNPYLKDILSKEEKELDYYKYKLGNK